MELVLFGGDWSFMLTWETNIIIGWWFNLVVFKEVVVNSIRGQALWRFVSPRILLGLYIFENIGVYVKSFGVWNIYVNFGGTWFIVCIVCMCVIELWLILWRDQYVYSFYHMERKKKISYSFFWRFGFTCFEPFLVWGVTSTFQHLHLK